MTERMTDEAWGRLHRYRGSATEDVRALYLEAERARRVEQEQAETLRVLTTALALVWAEAQSAADALPRPREAMDIVGMEMKFPVDAETTLVAVRDALIRAGVLK